MWRQPEGLFFSLHQERQVKVSPAVQKNVSDLYQIC